MLWYEIRFMLFPTRICPACDTRRVIARASYLCPACEKRADAFRLDRKRHGQSASLPLGHGRELNGRR